MTEKTMPPQVSDELILVYQTQRLYFEAVFSRQLIMYNRVEQTAEEINRLA